MLKGKRFSNSNKFSMNSNRFCEKTNSFQKKIKNENFKNVNLKKRREGPPQNRDSIKYWSCGRKEHYRSECPQEKRN